MDARIAVRSLALATLVGGAMRGCANGFDERSVGQIEQSVTQCPGSSTLNGVDVSGGNGAINWSAVHGAGYDFALMKATQGTGFTDARFAANWAGARAAGVARGAYHFFDPTVDGVVQANHFLAVMGRLAPGDLPPMLDVECPDSDPMCLGYAGGSGIAPAAAIRTRMMDWLNTVQAATGRTPMIYTFGSYFSSNAVDTTGLAAYPLFIANINPGSCFAVPSPWTRAVIRQYDWHGSVAGISGQVDRDYFYGTLADLTTFGSGGSEYAAQFVAQSWPLAAAGSVSMRAGQSLPAWIDLRNTGTRSWDANTRFATTNPRDRASVFARSDWVMPDRAAAVTGTVAPGAMFRFSFTLHAPATPGRYDERFGMVEDGTAWFSDSTQGGPPDGLIELLVDVTPDPDSGISTTDAASADVATDGAMASDVAARPDVQGAVDSGANGDVAMANDARVTVDVTSDGGPAGHAGGCTCAAVGMRPPNQKTATGLALLAVLGSFAARRRRRPTRIVS